MNKKTGVFIASRLNSERLPGKAILPIGKKNLWTIACEKLSMLPPEINKYALCSDWELIEIAERFPDIKVIVRDPRTSEVDGPLSYIFKDIATVPDTHLMFLNPCLIFLKPSTILNSIRKFNASEADYATSVKFYRNWLFDENNEPMTEINFKRLTTKEIPLIYREAAHCFHIFNKMSFFENGRMLDHGLQLLSVDGEFETTDIDTRSQYLYVKYLYEEEGVR